MAEKRQDAAQRRSSGGKGGSRSGGGPKKTGRGINRATGPQPSQASKGPREAPAHTTATRKSAAKDPPAKARIAPKSFEAAALRAAAGPPTPPPPAPVAPRRSGLGAPVFIGALLAVAGVVALIMIVTSGDEENTTVDTTPPALTLTPGKTGGTPDKAQPPAEPAGEPATRTANCDPIIGSGPGNRGHSYAVTS